MDLINYADKKKRKNKLTRKQKFLKAIKPKNVFKRVKKFTQKTVGATLLAPLFPFKRAIKKGLEKKGVSTKKMNFKDQVTKFFNIYVSKKNNKTSKFDEIPENYLADNPYMEMSLDEFNSLEEQENHVAVSAITTVVTAVIDIFKNSKNKKKKSKSPKKELTQDEQFLADEAEQVNAELMSKAKDEKIMKQGDMKKYMVWGFILIAVGFIAYLLFRKK